MTPLSPERLEELARALRAGAEAWRIAVEAITAMEHGSHCYGPDGCDCGKHTLEQRLAALGGEDR